MITIEIDNGNGLAVPEGKIDATIEMLIERIRHSKAVPAIGQNELVYGLRLAVKQKRIDPFIFVGKGYAVRLRESGNLEHYPKDFPGDVVDRLMRDIIRSNLVDQNPQ